MDARYADIDKDDNCKIKLTRIPISGPSERRVFGF
jgi:hypothetical protein